MNAGSDPDRLPWLYVLFNEEAKRPVVLPFRGEGPPVILAWSSRDSAERFLRSLPPDKRSMWRAYEWTAQDIGAWVRRDRTLAGVEMNAQLWPSQLGVLVQREVCESIGSTSGNGED